MDSIRCFDIQNGTLLKYCGNAEEVIVPHGVTVIGKGAFARTKIREVQLPESIAVIDELAFDSCYTLEWIYLPDSLVEIADGAFNRCCSLRDFRLPRSLRRIGMGAFSRCERLTSVELPEELEVIDNDAFANCRSLRRIALPRNPRHIGYHVLGGCENLEEIIYPQNTRVADRLFFRSRSGVRVIVPEGTTELYCRCFQGNDAIREILLPHSLTSIEDHAFSGCTALERIAFPNGASPRLLFRSSLQIHQCPALVLDDYILGGRFLFGAFFDDYDIAVLAGFLLQLRKDPSHYAVRREKKLFLVLKHHDTDISRKRLGAKTLGELLRTVILENRGLPFVKEIDSIISKGIFADDAEVTSILLDCKRRLGGIAPKTDDLLLP